MRRGERTYSAQRTYLRAGPRPALHLCSLDVGNTDALSCSPALLLWCTPVLLCLEERISQLLLSSRSYFFPTRLGIADCTVILVYAQRSGSGGSGAAWP